MECKVGAIVKKNSPPHLPVYQIKRSRYERSSLRNPIKTSKTKELKRSESYRRSGKEKLECQLQIQLNNRIIQQLTKEYENQLKPVLKRKTSSRVFHIELNNLDKFRSNTKSINETFHDGPKSTNKKEFHTTGLSNEAFRDSPKGLTNSAFRDSPKGLTNEAFRNSPKGLTNEAFRDSPIGLTNNAFEDSPVLISNGLCNPGYIESPDGFNNPAFELSPHVGLDNNGFMDSPELVIKNLPEMRHLTDITPRKARVDRHRQRWVAEELQTLEEEFEDVPSSTEMVNELSEKFEKRVSLADYLAMEKGKPFLSKKFLRVGSVKGSKNAVGKMRRISTAITPSVSTIHSDRAVHTSPIPFRHDVQKTEFAGPGEKAMDFWVDNFKIAARKKMERINKINIHLQALFSAVEHGQVEKVRTIVQSTEVDVNGLNNDHLTPLDVALLTNQRAVAKVLMSHGARPNSYFETPEKLGAHLRSLSQDAENRLGDFLPAEAFNNNGKGAISQANQPPTITSCHGGSEKEKEAMLWERRSSLLKKMLLGFQQARPPDVPSLVVVDVRGTTHVSVRFQPPESQENGLCTRIKVQWSECERFDIVAGEIETWDLKGGECRVSRLTQGKRYWFRAACANHRGFGLWRPSTPASVIPSSWRDSGPVEPRFSLCLQHLEDLFSDVRQLKPESTCEVKDFPEQEKPGETPALARRNVKKKTTIKQLFTATGKFQKNLKRGVFLSSLFYHEDKILVTNEDFLPTVEVDETYPSSYYHDLHWLMKVAATWDDVKCLRQDMERHLTSTTSHFRIKLLQAAQQMQSALNIDDLGQLHFQPIKDDQGTMVITTVSHVPHPKSMSVLNLRWVPLSKLQKKFSAPDESSVADLLMASIQNQMNHHQVSNVKLGRGLYLCYLKMRSSVDLIQIIVSHKYPNVLPYCKVRDNPHVSLEEWRWLKKINTRHKSLDSVKDTREFSEQQLIFLEQVANTARRLFSYMEVPLDEAMCHRVYDLEVVELSNDISLLIVVPPAEASCSAPGQEECLLSRGDLVGLPVQVFEMLHLSTYQPDVITRYSRLSCILELYLILAQHSQREAFSTAEVATAKDRLGKLQELHLQLNAVWKSVRWIMDVIAFTRDRSQSTSGISVSHLLALTRKSKCLKENHGLVKRSLLQLPDSVDPKLARANLARGSWSGSALESCVLESLSRSEQRLDQIVPHKPPAITCTRVISRLPSSRSEDHLLIGHPNVRPSTTSVSATNSPLMPPRHLTSSHTADSLRSISSDESTAAVVSLPVTTPISSIAPPLRPKSDHNVQSEIHTFVPPLPKTDQSEVLHSHRGASSSPGSPLRTFAPPLRAGCAPDSFPPPMRPSSSLLSLAKPALTDSKRPSLLSGNAIPVNINLRNSTISPGYKSPIGQLSTTIPPAVEDEEDKIDDSSEGVKLPTPSSGVLQVYAAYDTGLATGTSLQLHVTPRTSAREVVDLVVKQLNMAVLLKGRDRPIYTPEQLSHFCLVAVIGARERCLRDDFKPLQLQNPWKKGRLYVRQKQDVLAALEYSARQTAFL